MTKRPPKDSHLFVYSRADAIADGDLVDMSPVDSSMGAPLALFVPLAMTRAAVSAFEGDGPAYDSAGTAFLQILAGVNEAAEALRNRGAVYLDKRIPFTVRPPTEAGDLSLVVVVHRGDNHELVATIMLPDED